MAPAPASTPSRRILPVPAILAAASLHLGHRLHPVADHPLPALGIAGLALLLITLAGRQADLPRLSTRLLVLLVLAPASMRHALLDLPGATGGIALLLGAIAWPACAIVARLRGVRHGSFRQRVVAAVIDLSPRTATLARAELRLLWFGLLRWRRPRAVLPAGAAAFPSDATGTDVAFAWLTAAGIVVEIPLFHVLIRHVTHGGAWIATGIEVLSMIYLAGFAKSLRLCPTLLFPDRLLIRLGVATSRTLSRCDIDQARLLRIEEPRNPGVVRLFAFDRPNIAVVAHGREFRFRVDQPERLVAALQPG